MKTRLPDPIRPEGYALLAVIAALFVAELLVLGLWRVAAGTVTAARESGTRERSRIVAESALRRAVADWDELAIGTPPPGTWFALPGPSPSPGNAQSAVEAVALYRGIRLLRATATTIANGRVQAWVSVEAMLSAVPVDEFWRDFHSAVVAAGDVLIMAGDTIDGANAAIPPPWTAAECPPASLPALGPRPGLALAGATTPGGTGAVLAGAPPLLNGAPRASPADFDRIGGISAADFGAVADRLESGVIVLSPASAGTVCDTTLRGNWGEPATPAHPCHDYFPIIHAATDTEIAAGQGQGILLVDGDLRIAAGVRFWGVILVRGRIDAAGAEIHGSVRIAGNAAASRLGGVFRYEECALARAFRLAPGLRRLYRIAERWWLPAY